jgi:hypothetical protein
MDCESCGMIVPPGVDTCPWCRGSVTGGGCSDERGTETASRRPLVADGGGPPDDEGDPLSDPADDPEDDDKYEYLEPEDIVGEDANGDAEDASGDHPQGDDAAESGGGSEQPPGGDADEAHSEEQPPGGAPEQQPPEGAPEQQPPDSEQGRQPPGGAPEQQQPAGEPAQQQPGGAQGGQPLDDQPAGTGGSGGPTGEAGAPLGGSGQTAQQTAQQEEGGLIEELKRYPLKLGTALGVVAFLVPYILISLATFFGYEKPPGENYEEVAVSQLVPGADRTGWALVEGSQSWSELDVSAELFFTVIEFGRGDAFIDLFRRSAGVAQPSEVDPSNYPTVEDELEPLLELLAFDAFPEVPLLLLYIVAPYVLFLSSRYLARHYTPGERAVEYAIAGGTVTIGTTLVAFLLGLVFPVTDFAGRLLFAGILIPGFIGGVGGLSIYSFDDHSALVSTLTGWAAIGVGFVVGFLLLPLPDLDGAELQLSLLDRIVFGVGAYLNAAQFNIGSHTQGRVFFILVVVITVVAGFVRAWQAREAVGSRMDGARVGASIFFGFLGTIALLLWAFPMGTALTNLGLFTTDLGSGTAVTPSLSLFLELEPAALAESPVAAPVVTVESVTNLTTYLKGILVAGIIFPMTFGGLGGYLAVWFRDR